MPAGPLAPGFIYFVCTKLAGYSAYAAYAINRSKPVSSADGPKPSPLLAGLIRTGIGVGVGAVVGTLFWKLPNMYADKFFDSGLFFLVLVPFRIGEWWVLLRTVYRNFSFGKTKTNLIGGGVLTSFVLDAAGVALAFVLPGGMWVC